MNDKRRQYDEERLDKIQRHLQRRLDAQHARVARRMERVQQRMNRRFGRSAFTADMQARIIREGLELLKQDGLDKLSLRRLAQRLDMQAPALYWYFKDKAILVDYLAEGILQSEFGDAFSPRKDEESWQEWLMVTMTRLRRAMLAFPDGARVVAGARLYPAETLAQLIEYSLESLITAGVSPQQARTIHMTALTYTFGYVIEEQAAPTPEEAMEISMADFFNSYPYLHRMVGMIDLSEEARERQYQAGIQAIIKGSSFHL